MMKCPKCQHQQEDLVQCQSCGLIFAKYRAQQDAAQRAPLDARAPRAHKPWTIALTLLAASGAIGFWFMGGSKPAPVTVTAPVAETEKSNPDTNPAGITDLGAQLARSAPAANAIERARNATVFIKTSWGSGSGFFATQDCRIVTNKHVVRPDDGSQAQTDQVIASARERLENGRRQLENKKKAYWSSCRKCDEAGLAAYIEADERKLRALEDSINQVNSLVVDARTDSSFTITLSDGTEMPAELEKISDSRDLALLRLNQQASCPILQPGNPATLHQGDKLYTVGSPVGIKHVVTSGIFSGNTEVDGLGMLQTDAPINPGNSGGPLIDQNGKVVGINTLVAAKTQGIGFAIPYNVASQELGLPVQ